ncbi:MAG: exodeoxyribonuclease VII large subunit [Elusimicrobiaceae bacterium]|nr:exodeoxyribonuclease VII large subunit [Elusimicrobiaceae bacterium]
MSIIFDENKIFSVCEISGIIKEMLEGVLANICVEGEISNLKTAASGHIYFDLKDEDALISVVLFRGYVRGIKLKEGAKVRVRGDISCYIKSGRYQILAKSVEVQTVGDLYARFEALKAKLKEEGLFEQENKLPLPKFPSLIGVITSPTGAAVRDIISVLSRRAKHVQVILAPSLVQGEGAKEEIVQAIKNLNKVTPKPDVILLGRGGGSIEDLWCFNEEEVVRAVVKSKIPIISCVGHETDFTLTDFAASLRAPTPSAAAELVVQNAKDMLKHLENSKRMLLMGLEAKVNNLQTRLQAAVKNKIFKEPSLIFLPKEQELDNLQEKLFTNFNDLINKKEHALQLLSNSLNTLSPQDVLKRGYAIVRRVSDGQIVKKSIRGERLKVQTEITDFEVETI